MIPTPQLPTESESTAPSTLTLYQPFLGGLYWDLSGAGIRIVGREVWLNSSTYVIACLTHNKPRLFTLTSLMFKCISIVPYIPSSGGKKVPICDSLIFLKLPNYIDEILQRVSQIRGYNKPRFLPDLRSNLAVP